VPTVTNTDPAAPGPRATLIVLLDERLGLQHQADELIEAD
jgi:hypothetical protein